MKKVTILGSTGSIGTQALSVIDDNPDLFQIEALTQNCSAGRLNGTNRGLPAVNAGRTRQSSPGNFRESPLFPEQRGWRRPRCQTAIFC